MARRPFRCIIFVPDYRCDKIVLSKHLITDRAKIIKFSIINTLLTTTLPSGQSIFELVPSHFMEEPRKSQKDRNGRNEFIDPIRGRHIRFDTVHGVKGEARSIIINI